MPLLHSSPPFRTNQGKMVQRSVPGPISDTHTKSMPRTAEPDVQCCSPSANNVRRHVKRYSLYIESKALFRDRSASPARFCEQLFPEVTSRNERYSSTAPLKNLALRIRNPRRIGFAEGRHPRSAA